METDIEAWQLCWEIDLAFQTPQTEEFKCTICQATFPKPKPGETVYQSDFINKALERCHCHRDVFSRQFFARSLRASRSQRRPQTPQREQVCSSCGGDFVFEVINRTYYCSSNPQKCRRVRRVARNIISTKLEGQTALLQ